MFRDPWELVDLKSLTKVQSYPGRTYSSTRHNADRFVAQGEVYRFSDGTADPAYRGATSVFGITEGFQLYDSDGGLFLSVNGGDRVKLQGFEAESRSTGLNQPMATLSDNAATLLMPTGLWDARSGQCLASWNVTDRLAFDRLAQTALVRVAAGGSTRLCAYDLLTGKVAWQVSLDADVGDSDKLHIAAGPKSNRLAVWTRDGLDLFDTSTGKVIRRISNGLHLDPVQILATRDQRPTLLSASDHLVLAWRKVDGQFEREVLRTSALIRDLDLSEDGRNALVSLESGEVVLVAVEGDRQWTFRAESPAAAARAGRFTDTGHVVVAFADGVLRKLSAADGSVAAELKMPDASIETIAMTPSREYAIVATSQQQISRLDVARFKVTNSVRVAAGTPAICADDDGNCILGGGSIEAWSMTDGVKLWSIKTLGTPTVRLAYQPAQGRLIAVDAQGHAYAFVLKELSDTLENLGLSPLRGFARNRDEKLARSRVDQYFREIVLSDDVFAAIEREWDWNESTRRAALDYARSKAQTDQQLFADAWNQVNSLQIDQVKLAEAKRIAQALCRRQPQQGAFRRLLATIHYKTGQPSEALKALGTVSADDPMSLAIQMIAYLALDDNPSARRVLELARANANRLPSDKDPELPGLRTMLEDALGPFVVRAQEAYAKQDWTAAADGFSFAAPLNFSDQGFSHRWSDSLAMTGNWAAAADVHARAIDGGNDTLMNHWNEALLRLAAGDEERYRASCARLLKAYDDAQRKRTEALSEVPDGIAGFDQTAYLVALACGLGPRAVDNPSRVVALAQQAAETEPRNPAYWTVLATAQFRNGQAEESIGTLKKAMPLHVAALFAAPQMKAALRLSRLQGETVLAMAYHDQGNREAFAKQVATIENLIGDLEKSPHKAEGGLDPWAVPFAILISKRELAKRTTPAAGSN
jgi:outer membrane protein assembly factor BamB